jgi:tRNA(Ile)-lysidine synthetase-like protein
MIKFLGVHTLPKHVYVACSGGVDSMALVDFLIKGHRYVDLLFYHHNTPTSESAFKFLDDYADSQGLNLYSEKLTEDKPADLSPEEFWRNKRYEFLNKFSDKPVLTAHHLDDCVETYLMSCFHGKPKTVPYNTGNYYRPLLLNRKSVLRDWCERKGVPWDEDFSNLDTRYPRNRIRHTILPEVLHINPGIHKVVQKMVLTSLPPNV